MFKLARLDKNDIFYDLACGYSDAVYIASIEYKVKKAIGIEKRKTAVTEIVEKTQALKNVKVIINDIRRVDISDGNVFLLWSNDDRIIKKMIGKFSTELKDGSRIISILSPPGLIVPNIIDFPFLCPVHHSSLQRASKNRSRLFTVKNVWILRRRGY
jgi:Histone methylation protein DOT1.